MAVDIHLGYCKLNLLFSLLLLYFSYFDKVLLKQNLDFPRDIIIPLADGNRSNC